MAQIHLVSFENDQKFFFNLSANVGPKSPNKVEDVQLVQFGYFALSQNQTIQLPDTLRKAAAAVVPGAPYNGAANDPLTIAIKEDQKFRGGTQDGHVSVMRGNTIDYSAEHTWLIARLVNNMRTLMGRDFPRIDKHAKCPAQLATSVRRSFDSSK